MNSIDLCGTEYYSYLLLTYTVPPEVPKATVVSASQNIDISMIAAAGMLIAVTWGPAALRELSPQTRTILTHSWHPLHPTGTFSKRSNMTVLRNVQDVVNNIPIAF